MTVDEQLAALEAAVAQTHIDVVNPFVQWWTEHFPLHNDGWPCTVRDCDRDAAFTLFNGEYTMDQLQALAPVYWTVQAVNGHRRDCRCNPCYIAGSDKSIRVLQEKVDFIVVELRRRAQRTAQVGVPSTLYARDAEDNLATHLERVVARIHAVPPDTPTSVVALLAGIAEELEQSRLGDLHQKDGDRRRRLFERLDVLDAQMVQTLRDEAGAEEVLQVEAQADIELANYRGRMVPDAYRHAKDYAVDRLLRERYRLPVISFVGSTRGERRPADAHESAVERTGTD